VSDGNGFGRRFKSRGSPWLGDPDLHRVLETQLAWDLIGQQGGLGHEQTDQVVGQHGGKLGSGLEI